MLLSVWFLMLGWVMVGFLGVVVYLDAAALERADSIVYRDTVGGSPRFWALSAVLLVPVTLVYYLRRQSCLRGLESSEDTLFRADARFAVAREAAGVLMLWFLLFLPVAAVLGWWWGDAEDLGLWAVSGMVSQGLLVAAIAAAIHRRGGAGFWRVTGWSPPAVSPVKAFILPLLLGLALAGLAVAPELAAESGDEGLLTELAELGEPASSPVTEAAERASGSAFVWWALAAFLVAPFLEELIFRGYLFRVVSTLRGRGTAFLVASLAFGLLHVEQYWTDWLAIVAVMVVGFALSGLRLTTGSTLSSTVAHYAYNLGLLVVPFVVFMAQTPLDEGAEGSAPLAPAERQALFEARLEGDPDDPDARAGLARSLADQGGDLERAFELVEGALASRPDHPGYLDTRAEVLFRQGNVHEAIAIERWLTREYPEVEHYRGQLARFLEEGGNR